mgnify:CR=1 FL=1
MLLKLQICSGVRDADKNDSVDSSVGSGSGSGSGEPTSAVGEEYEKDGVVEEEEKAKINDDEVATSLLSSPSPSSFSATPGCRLEIRWSLCREDVDP